jgi:4-hydroxyphenylpyruvate dioxygenase
MAFRVRDAAAAFERSVALGAEPHRGSVGPMELNIPAIVGIGGSLIYFVDRYGDRSIYDVDFKPLTPEPLERAGLLEIDHLTHNVHRGHMDKWTGFYEKLFNFPRDPLLRHRRQEDRIVLARADSPAARSASPINESQDDKSQIEEYLREYRGEGIQHIALVDRRHLPHGRRLRGRGVAFQDTPERTTRASRRASPGIARMSRSCASRRISSTAAAPTRRAFCCRSSPPTSLGPIFFEIIQRKGNQGFGEGNFKALFESIELDQIRRGVI